jgi:hypothetical protein
MFWAAFRSERIQPIAVKLIRIPYYIRVLRATQGYGAVGVLTNIFGSIRCTCIEW